jgi:phenylalanyl-tRNA synthetase beta chain
MKVSLSWLKEYVRIESDIHDLASALTMAGLEVESVSNAYDYLEKVVVGRIIGIKPHPNATKLKICRVDAGDRIVQIVCGAPNAKENQTAILALPGAVLPDGSRLAKCEIRGEISEGMLCSERELELGDDKSGIMVLSGDYKTGECITSAMNLSDYVLEIGLTPNRSDCLSIIGIARETAAIQKTGIKYPDVCKPDKKKEIIDYTSVKIEAPEHCPRYSAGIVMDITVAPSPFWLRKKLVSIGQRPINNIVDITNFVMLECGQPLHAFDFDLMEENRIVVRTALKGEKFTTLDKKERILDHDMLMICDGKKPVAIAGIMGGLNSEIVNTTKRVLIESAYFNPLSVRKTSKRLGLSTEASYRFERGVDPAGTVKALMRAATLMADIGKGKLIKGVIDEHPLTQKAKSISLSINATNRTLGTKISKKTIKNLLESIEFKVKDGGADSLKVTPPSFRVDISRPEDLMEETARLYGYDRIPVSLPLMQSETALPLKTLSLREKIRNIMTGLSYSEAINYSFISRSSSDMLCLSPDDLKRKMVPVLNPLTEDQSVMRTSLVPGLLDTMRRNLSQQTRTLKIFETGKIFINNGNESLPEEIEMVAGLITGGRHRQTWYEKETECDFYDIKGAVEALTAGLNMENIRFTKRPVELCRYTRYGYSANIIAENETIGLIGEVHPEVIHNFDLKQKAFIFEIDCKAILSLSDREKKAGQLPKFPASTRDITIITDRNTEAMSILEKIKCTGEKLLENSYLFDIFEGASMPPGKRSISIRITYRSSEKTLEDGEVNDIHKTITDRLIKEFSASLPA